MLSRATLGLRSAPVSRWALPAVCPSQTGARLRGISSSPRLAILLVTSGQAMRPMIPRRLPSHHLPSPRRRFYHDDPRVRNARPLVTSGQLGRVVRSPNTHIIVVVAFLAAVGFYFSHLQTVPVSGRTRFNCYSEETVRQFSEMQYKWLVYEMEKEGGKFLPDWDRRTVMVKRVMKRLIPVSGMADQEWEVNVIDDPNTANAFVLPGGKVFVYSGILPLVRNESGLAAVLGHEIAHNAADHVGEHLSQAIGVNILLGSVLLLMAAIPGGFLAGGFFGGRLLDILFSRPMSRLQESEADYIGLMMMAEACYDPREAADFWRRMDKAQHLQPPEWISTHPSNQSRIEKIEHWMPEAMDKRQQSDCRGTIAFADRFRRALERGTIVVE